MKPIPCGRFNLIDGLPCLTCGMVALDWQKLARKKGSGYFPRKGAPVYMHVTLRREDRATRIWAVWDGGCVLTLNPRQPRQRDADTNSMSPPAGHL